MTQSTNVEPPMSSHSCLLLLLVVGNFSVWRICKNSYHIQYKTELILIPCNKLVELFTHQRASHQLNLRKVKEK